MDAFELGKSQSEPPSTCQPSSSDEQAARKRARRDDHEDRTASLESGKKKGELSKYLRMVRHSDLALQHVPEEERTTRCASQRCGRALRRLFTSQKLYAGCGA